MKRVELQLEINGVFQPVDLDEKTSFAITQKQSELTNPTVTKIPYSAQIALPKTKLNCRLFANMGIRSTADIVDPMKLINFRLYVNSSLYQQGYINIESLDIEDKGYYRIRLYGGLGDFFNYLSGIPLKDLDPKVQYEGKEINCTHDVNAEEVHKLLTEDNGLFGYALTYQGQYDKFENGKTENEEGIQDATWTNTLPRQNVELDENKRNEPTYSGEYRSYYQKPTIKFKPIFEEIIKQAKKDKYEIEYDEDFFSETNPYYNDLWLLCNNYEIGDSPGGVGLAVAEFGDNGTDRPDSQHAIKDNNAVNIKGDKIPAERFISNDQNTPSMDNAVAISGPIPVKKDQILNVNLYAQVIATIYDSGNESEHYRGKNPTLTCGVRIVDAKDPTNVLAKYEPPTPAPSGKEVSSRQFNRSNVDVKRPKKFSTGIQNFIYDEVPSKTNNVPYTVDAKTIWRFKQTCNIEQDGEVVVIFHVTGNASWYVKSKNHRKYGVAFKMQDNSSILVSGKANPEDLRSNSEKTFEDIIGEDYTCYDLLLSYCKLFGLLLKVDNVTNKIKILLRDNYYTNETIDWTDKVDRSKEFSLEPLAFKFQRGVFKYNSLDTKYEEEYRKANDGQEYGSYHVSTGYKLEAQDYNYLDGIIFDNCIIASGYSQYFAGRDTTKALRDNKQLPYLQSADGSKVELNGFIPLFRDKLQDLKRDCRITDDTEVMKSHGQICWNNSLTDFKITDKIANYIRTIKKDDEFYSLNFGQPKTGYSDSESLPAQPANSGIYFRYWRAYIQDRTNRTCKILTCYVYLTPSDVSSDLLSKFIYLDDSIWAVDEISAFNPLSSAPTKVKLVKVKDMDNYLYHDNNSEEFKIMNNGEVVYDNLNGNTPALIVINSELTSLAFDISSTVKWTALSNATIDPVEGNPGNTTMTVTIPTDQNTAYVRFVYDGNSVIVRMQRKKLYNVTASHVNGQSVQINGLDSPQQIESGRNATFTATGSTSFVRWEINGQDYTNEIANITIKEDTTATAHFTAPGQIKLYCDDNYTTVAGVQKTGKYWILNVGQSYTFSNSQTNFSGFLFSTDEEYSKQGAKTIKAEYGTLAVYYDRVLLNITVENKSPFHKFTGESISIGDKTLDFEIPPSGTEKLTEDVLPGSEIIPERMDYHYPMFTPLQTTYPTAGVFNLTIKGERVGWDGSVSEVIQQAGYAKITRMVYSPVAFTLTSDVTITPKSGSSNTNVSITLEGKGGKVIQKVGGFEYERVLEQKETKPVGWYFNNKNGVIILETTANATDESARNQFYFNNFQMEFSKDLTKDSSDVTESDGSVSCYLKAQFGSNPGGERKISFNVQCNGTAYIWNITQKGGASTADATWWGRTMDDNNVVTGPLTGADGIKPSESGTKKIGDPGLQYSQIYARRLDIGSPNYSEENTGEMGISINGQKNEIYCFGNQHSGGFGRRGLVVQSAFEYFGSPMGLICNIGPGTWMISQRLLVGGYSNTDSSWDERHEMMQQYTLYAGAIGCNTINGEAVSFSTSTETSDINLKNIHEKVENVDLSPVGAYKYTYKDDETNRVKVGVIAQEVEKICPEAVYGEEGNKSVNYNALVALLIQKVNELEKRIQELENKK